MGMRMVMGIVMLIVIPVSTEGAVECRRFALVLDVSKHHAALATNHREHGTAKTCHIPMLVMAMVMVLVMAKTVLIIHSAR